MISFIIWIWCLTSDNRSGAAPAAEEDDDIDLFGSDDEEVDEEAERIKAQRLAEYNAKKAAKPKPIAKTTVTLEVKPWDDETDIDAMTKAVREISMEGLLWGGFQHVPVGFGIKKLQINCVVEDDKVNIDGLDHETGLFIRVLGFHGWLDWSYRSLGGLCPICWRCCYAKDLNISPSTMCFLPSLI